MARDLHHLIWVFTDHKSCCRCRELAFNANQTRSFEQHKDENRVLGLNGIVGRPAVMLAADQQAIPSWAGRKSEICQTGACTGDP